MVQRFQLNRISGGLFVLLAAGALYLATLDNGLRPGELAGGDLITHQVAQVLGRPSNAPGYPLYTMGGWLWFHVLHGLFPQANPVSILAGYSTLWALLALAVLYRLLLDVSAGNRLLALLVTALYAVSYFFWYYAVTTEQYTSAVLQTLLFVWVAWTWERRVRAASPGPHPAADRLLIVLALLCGIALAHMVTVLAILPPLVWWVLGRQPGLLRRPRLWGLLLLALALPLLSYVFIYVQGARHPEWRGVGTWPTTWDWFWSFVSTQQGRGELTWTLQPLTTAEWPGLYLWELTPLGLVAGVAGWFWLGRRGLLLAGTALIYLVFSFIDRLGNWYQVVMPVYALLAIGIGVTADRLGRGFGPRALADSSPQALRPAATQSPRRTALRALIVLVLLGGTAAMGAANFSRADQRNRPGDTGLLPGWEILARDPPSGAAIVATLPEADALRYLSEIGGLRPDIVPITTAQARTRLQAGQAVYVTRAAAPLIPEEVLPAPHYESAGPGLAQVLIQARFLDNPRLSGEVGDGLALVESSVSRVSHPRPLAAWAPPGLPMPGLIVHLAWYVRTAPQFDWSISMRPQDQGEAVVVSGQALQVDSRNPVLGLYPTSRWQAGELVQDDYFVPLPADVAVDGVVMIVYRQLETGEFVNLAEIPLALP